MLYVLGKFARPREAAARAVYLAYSIGPEFLAIAVQELDAAEDVAALERAVPLFHEDLKRNEVCCGSRKELPHCLNISRSHNGASGSDELAGTRRHHRADGSACSQAIWRRCALTRLRMFSSIARAKELEPCSTIRDCETAWW